MLFSGQLPPEADQPEAEAQFPPKFLNMCYVYVLESLKNGKRYIDSTRLIPAERLEQHNGGSNKWSRENKPFRLIYFEEYHTYSEARKRENYLKTSNGRRFIKGRIAQLVSAPR